MLANRLNEIPMQRGTIARTRVLGANNTTNSPEVQPTSTVWAYVDGNPFTADVKTNIVPAVGAVAETGTWKTMLFGSLGRGGGNKRGPGRPGLVGSAGSPVSRWAGMSAGRALEAGLLSLETGATAPEPVALINSRSAATVSLPRNCSTAS